MTQDYLDGEFIEVPITSEDRAALQTTKSAAISPSFAVVFKTHVMEENMVVNDRVSPTGWVLSARIAVRGPCGSERAFTVCTNASHEGYTREFADTRWAAIFTGTLVEAIEDGLLETLMEDSDDLGD